MATNEVKNKFNDDASSRRKPKPVKSQVQDVNIETDNNSLSFFTSTLNDQSIQINSNSNNNNNTNNSNNNNNVNSNTNTSLNFVNNNINKKMRYSNTNNNNINYTNNNNNNTNNNNINIFDNEIINENEEQTSSHEHSIQQLVFQKLVKDWSETDVLLWLQTCGLSDFEPQFREGHVDGKVLLNLEEEDYSQISLNRLSRKRLRLEVELLRKISYARKWQLFYLQQQ
eukprot:TRINITY_DN3955_c1_g2_i2.p1 TRINITY_DN3955_c1_g2~~TRINITY_DN3955_c1_g2_i2.p1  ORF type:complete len:227 (-),score=102.71 TRINITY_DN3955_c1_g2_i2:14-694(-)